MPAQMRAKGRPAQMRTMCLLGMKHACKNVPLNAWSFRRAGRTRLM